MYSELGLGLGAVTSLQSSSATVPHEDVAEVAFNCSSVVGESTGADCISDGYKSNSNSNSNRTSKGIDFRGKLMLAPMVRAGSLPLRTLALNYGCDLVYSEEIIDKKLSNARRVVNTVLNTIDFVVDKNAILFRTSAFETSRVILQLGTRNGLSALEAARVVENDVAGIDVNMGCPKSFSIQGQMGAALLKEPLVAQEIIRTLKQNLSIPVTAKIRLLDTLEDTIEFIRGLEEAGADAVAIHLRTREMDAKTPSDRQWLSSIIQATTIPIIINGDIYSPDIFDTLIGELPSRDLYASRLALMIGRPVLLNASIIKVLKLKINEYLHSSSSSNLTISISNSNSSSLTSSSSSSIIALDHIGELSIPNLTCSCKICCCSSSISSGSSDATVSDAKAPYMCLMAVIRDFLINCMIFDPMYQIVKYTLMEMMISRRHPNNILDLLRGRVSFGKVTLDIFDRVQASKSTEEICSIFELQGEYNSLSARYRKLDVSLASGSGGKGCKDCNSSSSKRNVDSILDSNIAEESSKKHSSSSSTVITTTTTTTSTNSDSKGESISNVVGEEGGLGDGDGDDHQHFAIGVPSKVFDLAYFSN